MGTMGSNYLGDAASCILWDMWNERGFEGIFLSCGDPKLRNLKVYSCWLACVVTSIHRGPKAPLGDFRLNI